MRASRATASRAAGYTGPPWPGKRACSAFNVFAATPAQFLPALKGNHRILRVLVGFEDARDDGDRDAEPLLDAVRAWHKARSSANRDQRLLDTTEADLLDESRRRFEW